MIVEIGDFLRVPSSRIPRKEDQVGPCEQLDALPPFNFERNAMKERKIYGLSPSSPPHKNYKITSRMPLVSSGHGEKNSDRATFKPNGITFHW